MLNQQFRLPDKVVVEIAERCAPYLSRRILARVLVGNGLYTFNDFQEMNYGSDDADFITYTLLENANSRERTIAYLETLNKLLSSEERLDLGQILPRELRRPGHSHKRGRGRPTEGKSGTKARVRHRRRKGKKAEIFLAHSSADKKFVRKLATDLRSQGVRVWLDEWEIKVGDSIVEKVQRGIRSHPHLGVVLSPEALRSRWLRGELSAGLVKELRSNKVVVLPILHKNCRLPLSWNIKDTQTSGKVMGKG